MKTPIDMMLDGVTWVKCEPDGTAPRKRDPDGIPVETHEGVLELLGYKLRCFRLNNGMTIIDADDFERFFEGVADETPSEAEL